MAQIRLFIWHHTCFILPKFFLSICVKEGCAFTFLYTDVSMCKLEIPEIYLHTFFLSLYLYMQQTWNQTGTYTHSSYIYIYTYIRITVMMKGLAFLYYCVRLHKYSIPALPFSPFSPFLPSLPSLPGRPMRPCGPGDPLAPGGPAGPGKPGMLQMYLV